MKRARALFTEGYNCQKNKRSQDLFAHIFLHRLPAFRQNSSYPVFWSPATLLPELPSRASYIPHSIHPRFLLSLLWLPPVHASPTHHYRAVIVVPSILRRSFLAFLSRFQPSSWLHGKATHSSRGSTNSQLRSFTSTWLPTLMSTLKSLPPPSPFRRLLVVYVRSHLRPHLVLHRDAVSFLSKFITKTDNARRSNVGIRLIEDTPMYV